MREMREKMILEPFFTLWYYGGMTWQEYYSMPTYRKVWLIDRMQKEIAKATEANQDIPDKSPFHNHPQTREMLGKTKNFVNPKTWRPT